MTFVVDFSQPYMPNASNMLDAITKVRALNQTQDDQATDRAAGALAAQGDWSGAANVYNSAGKLQAGQNALNYGQTAARRAAYSNYADNPEKLGTELLKTGDPEAYATAMKIKAQQDQLAADKAMGPAFSDLITNPAAKQFATDHPEAASHVWQTLGKLDAAQLEEQERHWKPYSAAVESQTTADGLNKVFDIMDKRYPGATKVYRDMLASGDPAAVDRVKGLIAGMGGLTQEYINSRKNPTYFGVPGTNTMRPFYPTLGQYGEDISKPPSDEKIDMSPGDRAAKIAKDAEAIKAANPGMSDGMAMDLARNKNLRAVQKLNANGVPEYSIVEQPQRVAAEQQVLNGRLAYNKQWNDDHKADIDAGKVQPKTEDPNEIDDQMRGLPLKAQNYASLADYRARLAGASEQRAATGEANQQSLADYRDRQATTGEGKLAETGRHNLATEATSQQNADTRTQAQKDQAAARQQQNAIAQDRLKGISGQIQQDNARLNAQDGGNRPTDLQTIQEHVSKWDVAKQNADTGAQKAAEQAALGEAKLAQGDRRLDQYDRGLTNQERRTDILSDAEKRKTADASRVMDLRERGLTLQEQKFAEGTPMMREAMSYMKAFNEAHAKTDGAQVTLDDSMRIMKNPKLDPKVDPNTKQVSLVPESAAGKLSSQAEAAKSIEDSYASRYQGAKPLPHDAAISAATAITSKFNAGLQVIGWNFDADGNPTTPIYSAPKGTSAELRANQWNEDAQFMRARAQKGGGLQANNDQRAAYVTPVYNHLSNFIGHLHEQGAARGIGIIQGDPKYQAYRGLMFPSDTETPIEYGKLRQDLESAQAEVERLYLSGQGVVTDSERSALKGIIIAAKDAPNIEAAEAMALNAQKLVAGIVETPSLDEVRRDPTLKAAREAGLKKLSDFIKNNNLQSATSGSSAKTEGSAPAAKPEASASGANDDAYAKWYQKKTGNLPPSVQSSAPAQAPAPAAQEKPVAASGEPKQVNSKEEFDALPSGAVFIAPDGSKRRKP